VQNVNVVVITGNLTKDPELRYAEGGMAISEIRIAVNGRRKDGEEWVDKANFFNVVLFGGRAEAVVQHLSKGSGIAVEGRLDWQEWEAKDGSGKRQAVKIIAANVQFLSRKAAEGEAPGGADPGDAEPQLAGVGAGGGEEDIPF
jgi:single-strand DNA-binding protein